jgi:hypothetical protein
VTRTDQTIPRRRGRVGGRPGVVCSTEPGTLTGGVGLRMRQLPEDLFARSACDEGHLPFDQTPCGAIVNSRPCALRKHAPDRSPYEGM